MRFCLNCKKEISETAHFCSNVCKAEYVVSAFDKHLENARERLKEDEKNNVKTEENL